MNDILGSFHLARTDSENLWLTCRCEAFSTYPRTYDLIHAAGLLSLYIDRWPFFHVHPLIFMNHAAILQLYGRKTSRWWAQSWLRRCDILDILLEIDRILRPEGVVIIRDHVDVVAKAKAAADRLNWQSRIVHTELGPFHPEKILVVDNSLGPGSKWP